MNVDDGLVVVEMIFVVRIQHIFTITETKIETEYELCMLFDCFVDRTNQKNRNQINDETNTIFINIEI